MDIERRRFLFLKVIARFSVCGDFLSVLFTVFAGIPTRIRTKYETHNGLLHLLLYSSLGFIRWHYEAMLDCNRHDPRDCCRRNADLLHQDHRRIGLP